MKGKLKVTASGGKNPGANLKPDSKMAPKSSKRPRTRSDKQFEVEADAAADRAMKHSQPPTLVYKAMGGKLKMVEKGGKKVPAFAADGVGKMAMGGKVSEYGGKEMYKSKAAMMKHEGSESMAEERKERKMAMGGMCRGMGAATKGGNYKG
jgi:hypothetical protein